MKAEIRHREQIERFNSRYVKIKNGCWNWTWKKDKDGYGQFHARPIAQRAHRFSFYIHMGYLPKDKCICHTCDNPSCVNPAHLWAGTSKENNNDARKKGRMIPPNRGKKRCKRGHLFTSKNTYRTADGGRICIRCRRAKIQEWKRKNRDRTYEYYLKEKYDVKLLKEWKRVK